MATTKTLTPTNEPITIDAFQGEKPDYRHVADAEMKLADAVNALNSQIATAPVTFTSYDALKSGIQTKAGTMASGSIASFDFRANFSTTAELPNAYYTCIIRKYDNNSYVADIISNIGSDYKLSYAGNTWRMVALADHLAKFYRDPSNAASFTIDLGQINTSRYRLAILFQYESGHPSMNFISLGSGASPTVTVQKVFGDANSSSPSSVTMNNSTLTINYANTAYGGISLLWLD